MLQLVLSQPKAAHRDCPCPSETSKRPWIFTSSAASVGRAFCFSNEHNENFPNAREHNQLTALSEMNSDQCEFNFVFLSTRHAIHAKTIQSTVVRTCELMRAECFPFSTRNEELLSLSESRFCSLRLLGISRVTWLCALEPRCNRDVNYQ